MNPLYIVTPELSEKLKQLASMLPKIQKQDHNGVALYCNVQKHRENGTPYFVLEAEYQDNHKMLEKLYRRGGQVAVESYVNTISNILKLRAKDAHLINKSKPENQ